MTKLGGGSQKLLMQYEPAFSIDEDFAKTVLADEDLDGHASQNKEPENSNLPDNTVNTGHVDAI